MEKPLLVFALAQESQDVFTDYDVLYTGVGKVNAAYALAKYLQNHKPSLVINLGTAGSVKHPGGAIINPTRFIQRDMDVTVMGFEKFQTPFSSDPVIIEYGLRAEGLPGATCGTGDHFDTSGDGTHYDVVDMEAFALALTCQRENVPFLCLKYISDGADENADQDWMEALHDTAEALRDALGPVLKQ